MRSPTAPHRLRAIAVATLVATLATLPSACEEADVAGPPATLGHWRLVSIDGDPVAGKGALAADGAGAVLDSSEIIFRRYGRLQDIRHLWRQAPFGPRVFFSDSMIQTYVVRRDSIFVTRERYYAPDTYVDTGVIAGDVMEIAVRLYTAGSGAYAFPIWRYTRIGETPQ